MAKSWAKKFYDSKKWARARELCVSLNHGICSRCGRSFPSKSLIVHHKIYLTETNINDANISLNQDNLECICHNCHNAEHMSKKNDREIFFDDKGNVTKIIDRD